MSKGNDVISENARRLRAMHEELHNAFQQKPNSPRHRAACKAFSDHFDTLAFPGGLARGIERLKALDPVAVETAIQFLEEDPWFFRSGYIKEDLARLLKHAPLSGKQQVRLAALVLRSIRQGTRRLASHVATLAPAANSATFLKSVEAQSRAGDLEIRRRAEHILRVLKSPLTSETAEA